MNKTKRNIEIKRERKEETKKEKNREIECRKRKKEQTKKNIK